MWFRMSHLIQKWPKNKANFWFISPRAQQAMPLRRENEANFVAEFARSGRAFRSAPVVILSEAKNLALVLLPKTNRDSSLRSE